MVVDNKKLINPETNENLDPHTEFETKYKVEGSVEQDFKTLVMGFTKELGKLEFIYAEGPDHYYIKPDDSFLRYRKAINDKQSWVTMKEKPKGAGHNIKRKEVNWRVDNTPTETIHEGALMQGYTLNFKIYKVCHIYKFKEVTFVFYRVVGEDNRPVHFIEIELDEARLPELP